MATSIDEEALAQRRLNGCTYATGVPCLCPSGEFAYEGCIVTNGKISKGGPAVIGKAKPQNTEGKILTTGKPFWEDFKVVVRTTASLINSVFHARQLWAEDANGIPEEDLVTLDMDGYMSLSEEGKLEHWMTVIIPEAVAARMNDGDLVQCQTGVWVNMAAVAMFEVLHQPDSYKDYPGKKSRDTDLSVSKDDGEH